MSTQENQEHKPQLELKQQELQAAVFQPPSSSGGGRLALDIQDGSPIATPVTTPESSVRRIGGGSFGSGLSLDIQGGSPITTPVTTPLLGVRRMGGRGISSLDGIGTPYSTPPFGAITAGSTPPVFPQGSLSPLAEQPEFLSLEASPKKKPSEVKKRFVQPLNGITQGERDAIGRLTEFAPIPDPERIVFKKPRSQKIKDFMDKKKFKVILVDLDKTLVNIQSYDAIREEPLQKLQAFTESLDPRLAAQEREAALHNFQKIHMSGIEKDRARQWEAIKNAKPVGGPSEWQHLLQDLHASDHMLIIGTHNPYEAADLLLSKKICPGEANRSLREAIPIVNKLP